MIYTWSKFNYGHTITNENKYIPFDEGSGELTGTLEVGNYSLGEFAQAVQDALNAEGDLSYTVTLNRGNNSLTIAADDTFSLLILTGSTTATAYELMGFSLSADKTGADTYTSNASGDEYYPQFWLQSYVAPENFVSSVEATINKSADGRVEVVRFGLEQKIEMDLKFITNLTMDGQVIRNNASGLQDARDFMGYITQKKKFEFVPDLANPETYYKVILESTPDSSNGTGFKLRELFGQNLPDIYETGVITLRVVE